MPNSSDYPVRRALISTYDKQGLVPFARALRQQWGIEILSSGGTSRLLHENGIDVVDISSYTAFPEMMDGRVKTLHPKIHGGILALRDKPDHLAAAEKHGIRFIDLVVVNLYPFEDTVAKPDVSLEEALENIDIGGPSLIRAAAKNHPFVTVVVDPQDYSLFLEELEKGKGTVSATRRFTWARKAFERTAQYDATIAHFLRGKDKSGDAEFPEQLILGYSKAATLRYGENPHQRAALYEGRKREGTLAGLKFLQGKELSYNNLVDVDAALCLIREFDEPSAAIIKHKNPCGVASAATMSEAFAKAWKADSVSAYGGIAVCNHDVDEDIARTILEHASFLEVIATPRLSAEALKMITQKAKWGKNVRLLETAQGQKPVSWSCRSILGDALLLQTPDSTLVGEVRVTTVKPTAQQERDLLFAWKVAKHVVSNAIVLAKEEQTVGIGAGQMSRLDAVKMVLMKAGERARGAVLASDAFFPFKDGVEEALHAGVTAFIQPGGSIRDGEVIEAARRANAPMIFTSQRHFRH